jgi:F-box-like
MSSALCANCGYTIANGIQLPTTPVPDLIHGARGAYVASESQVQLIHDTISSAQADISQLDGEIYRLQALLDGLIHKRDTLQTYTRSHTALIAPIGRLPPEILSEIFLHCRDPKKRRLDKVPLSLGSVCSRWRTIALSTAQLWASFALTIESKYLRSDEMLAKTWLARAGTCPLTIRLACGDYGRGTLRPLMDVFLLHCERWYDIHLSLPTRILGFLAPAKNHLPQLHKLYIDRELTQTLDIFEFAPQLRSVQLDLAIPSSMVTVPWGRIEYFDMGRRTVDECLELLRATPNLEKCVVRLTRSQPRDSHSPVQLLRLRSMIITGGSLHLFDTLLLPKLQEISIDLLNDRWIATQQLISLLSQCSLEALYLKLSHLPPEYDMIQILQTCSSLVRLDLLGRSPRCMTTSFLARFALRRDPENVMVKELVPMLQTFTVDYSPTLFNISHFLDTIQSRVSSNDQGLASDHITSLQRVEIRDIRYGTLGKAILSRLRQLRETGLDIYVVWKDLEYMTMTQ